MKQFFIFIGGMFTGALLLYAIFYFISVRTVYSETEQLRYRFIETLTNSLEDLNKDLNSKAEVQYVEVKGKKGIVTLHTGMSKDSVQILVGKPDEVKLNTYGSSTHEDWSYKINNKYISDLDLDFENGKLKAVRQN